VQSEVKNGAKKAVVKDEAKDENNNYIPPHKRLVVNSYRNHMFENCRSFPAA
jgi:hypothetical protein